jgi:hypothetical protein
LRKMRVWLKSESLRVPKMTQKRGKKSSNPSCCSSHFSIKTHSKMTRF